MKSFHIWDFPDSIYVLLRDNAKEEFFKEMYNKFGNRERYAKFLNLDPSTVKEYHEGFSDKDKKKWIQYVPVRILKKSKKFLSPETKKLIENNIFAYRSRAGSPIENPILPIKESPAMYRLLGHIFGDGSATKRHVPYYANTCKELREEFIRDLQIFGHIKWTARTLTVPIVTFQKAITHVLAHIFEISFDKKDKLPERVFSAPIECKCALLRALFDDEGTCSHNIAIGMNGEWLVRDIKKLLESININCGKISFTFNKSGKKYFILRISSKSDERFAQFVGFSHPKKAENLRAAIKRRCRKQRCRSIEEIENLILSYLKGKDKVGTISIANELNLTIGHVLTHLKRMESDKKIKSSIEKNKYFVWSKI